MDQVQKDSVKKALTEAVFKHYLEHAEHEFTVGQLDYQGSKLMAARLECECGEILRLTGEQVRG